MSIIYYNIMNIVYGAMMNLNLSITSNMGINLLTFVKLNNSVLAVPLPKTIGQG